MSKYQPKQFEDKWIKQWNKENVYKTSQPDNKHKKMYTLSMFPYPSGAGLHVGHVRIYMGTDVMARFFRMQGYTVLHPMGWDAFGLPAENAAVKAKKNPMDMVPENIANFKRQMNMMGFSNDWDREFATTDPAYYRFTQWLFIQFFKMGLLYKRNTAINFCPACKTGLSEEEVLPDGTHERCDSKITKKELPQWIFKITAYADRLLKDLDGLDWPQGILEMQRNWIGKSEGVNFKEKVRDMDIEFEVFDTVPQTYIAQTFTVIAPEHPMVEKLVKGTKYEKEVMAFVEKIKKKKLAKKFDTEKEIEGVFTGRYVKDPFGKGDLPIWAASYVLYEYGTGIVNCSAHDERDFEFAKKYKIPLRIAMLPKDEKLAEKVKNLEVCYYHAEDGIIQEPEEFKRMTWKEVRKPIIDFIEKKGLGKRAVTYHLRDWIFSRQRYWGEPIPMIYCEKCAKDKSRKSFTSSSENNLYGWFPVPEDELPVKLPYVKQYEPLDTGESPLATFESFVKTTCPYCGGPARRETDTMPNWAGSCWYFLAFAFWNQAGPVKDFPPANARPATKPPSLRVVGSPSSPDTRFPNIENCLHSETSVKEWKLKIENSLHTWLPVDWYLGGAEHAVLHLLYARFWVKALNDLGLLDFSEPFMRLRNVGMVLAEGHRKMSKSFNNVVNPDDVVAEFGADALRLYEMFMAPFSAEISWSTKALQGTHRFLRRVWEICHQIYEQNGARTFEVKGGSAEGGGGSSKVNMVESSQLISKLNKTILKVTKDIQETKFNTAIAAMMEFLNEWEGDISSLSVENMKKFLQILAPFAPFMTEELWRNVMGEKTSIHLSSWPIVNEKEIIEKEVEIPVQVNGKHRATLTFSRSELSKEAVVQKALAHGKIKQYVGEKEYKVIYVEGKILNFIVR